MRIVLILLLTVSCSESNLKSSVPIKSSAQSAADADYSSSQNADPAIKPADASKAGAPSADQGDDELASPPVKVTGSFLYCVPLLNSATLPNNSYIGCRLNDAQGRKVDPRRLAKTFQYKFEMAVDDRIKLVTRMSSNSLSNYDAFLDLSTDTKISTSAALAKIQIKVELHGLVDGNEDLVVASPIKAVLQNETSGGNNSSWSNNCVNGGCEFRDNITGLYWTSFQPSATYAAAQQFCQNSSFEGAAWRLASANEMYVARANKIGGISYNAIVAAEDPYLWTSDSAAALGGGASARIVVNPVSPNVPFGVFAESVELGFACTRQ